MAGTKRRWRIKQMLRAKGRLAATRRRAIGSTRPLSPCEMPNLLENQGIWRVAVASPGASPCPAAGTTPGIRSEEHTSELQSLMRISYAVFCLKKKKNKIMYRHLNNCLHCTQYMQPQRSVHHE